MIKKVYRLPNGGYKTLNVLDESVYGDDYSPYDVVQYDERGEVRYGVDDQGVLYPCDSKEDAIAMAKDLSEQD